MAIALADQLHASRTILACMSAILFYDAFASLPKEWRIIWNGRKNIGFVKACCVVNKYGSILAMIMYLIWMYNPISHETCRRAHIWPYVVALTALTCGDLILAVRLYALHQKDVKVVAFFGTFLLVLIGVDAWSVSANHALVLPIGERGCISVPGEHLAKYAYVPWVLCCFYDFVALVVTIVRIWKYRRNGGGSAPIFTLILQDGVAYFLIVFSAKLAATLCHAYYDENPTLLVPVAASLSAISCGRLLFNLQESNGSQSALTPASSRSWRSRFTSSRQSAAISGSKIPAGSHIVSFAGEDTEKDVELADIKQETGKQGHRVGI